MEEVFKPIRGYKGLYSVSTLGRVYSHRSKKFIKPQHNGWGYFRVSLIKDGVAKSKKLHRIVATAFLRKNRKCYEIDHIDHNTSNNAVSNLKYVTHKANILKTLKSGRGNRKSKPPFLTKEEADIMRDMYFNQNIPQTEISRIFGCSRPHVCNICNNKHHI